MNPKNPSLSDLGLDQPIKRGPIDRAFNNFEDKEVEKTWIDSVKLDKKREFNPGIAACLSFVIPGAGQAYKLHVLSAFFWFITTVILYFLAWPLAILCHVACVLFAALAKQ